MSVNRLKKKKRIKKSLLLTFWFLLTGGIIISVCTSQLSFATNSLENSIQLLNQQNQDKDIQNLPDYNSDQEFIPYVPDENEISTFGAESIIIYDKDIGLIANSEKGSPFLKTTNQGPSAWTTRDGYRYFFPPRMDNFDPNEWFTKPGISMGWNPKDRAYRPFFSAGPSMFSFYTRILEDYYYSTPEYQNIFQNDNQKAMFENIFFNDIADVERNEFYRFVNDITSVENHFGTDNPNQRAFTLNPNGSVMSKMLFTPKPGYKGNAYAPNIELDELVFYPSGNYPWYDGRWDDSWFIVEPISVPIYNKVWIGNELFQEGPGVKDYYGQVNTALMRAMTLDTFTLVSHQDNLMYRATGNIKFRIFYEYDFKHTVFVNDDGSKSAKVYFDVNSLRYLPSSYINDYFDQNPDGSVNINAPREEMFKQLIVGLYNQEGNKILKSNIDILFKNLSYHGDDLGRPGFNYQISINPYNVSLQKDNIQIDYQNKTITFGVVIDVKPQLVTNVTFQFHNNFNTNLINTVIQLPETSEYKNTASTQITIDQAQTIIANNLTQIFDNVVPNCTVTIKPEDFDNISGIRNGEIYVKAITLNKSYQGGVLVDNQTFSTGSNFVIRGFKKVQNQGELYIELYSHVNIFMDVSSTEFKYVLAQTIAQFIKQQDVNNPDWVNNLNTLKQFLIDNRIIANPVWANKLRTEDFDFEVVNFNNVEGSITLDVAFHASKGNIYMNGELVPSVDKSTNQPAEDIKVYSATIHGFLSFNQTTIKDGMIDTTFVDNVNNKDSKIFANQMTLEKVQLAVDDIISTQSINAFVNNPIILSQNDSQVLKYNNWLKDTSVEVISFTPNYLQGTVDVEAKLISYQDRQQVIEKSSYPFYFKLNGYYDSNNPNDQIMFNTNVIDGQLSSDYSLNPNPPLGFIPSSLIDNDVEQEENIRLTKQAIIDGGYIKNLTQAITVDDFDLNIKEVNDKQGFIVCDITIKKGAQSFKDGIYQEYNVSNPFVVNNIKFSGFKTFATTTSIANNSIDLLANDKPPVFIPSVVYNNLNLTDVSLNNTKATAFINYIAKQIFEQIQFTNLNPDTGDITSANYSNVIEIVSFNTYSDLDGTMEVSFKVKDPYYMDESVPTSQTKPFKITINGFHKLVPTALPVEDIKNDINLSLNNKEFNVYQVLSDPTYQRQIKELIIANSSQYMFPDIVWNDQEQTLLSLTRMDISFDILNVVNGNNPDEFNGSFDLAVTINKPWVDKTGRIISPTYNETIHFGDYKNESNVTILQPTGSLGAIENNSSNTENKPLVDDNSQAPQEPTNKLAFSNWNASDIVQLWSNPDNSEIINQQRDLISKLIIQQLIDPKKGLIQNWTGQGFSKLNVNDISIQVANDSSKKPYDNFKGTVDFNVTIHNYKGLVNVNGFIQPQQNLNLGTITLSGFRKLMVTSLPIDDIKEALKPSSPDEDINEAIKRIALEDFKSIKNQIVNQQIDGQYVAFNKYPHLENVNDLYKAQQIQIQILNRVSASPTGGSFDIRITINQDWVNDLGEIQKGPFVSELINIGGFKNQTNTTTIKPNITLKGFDNATDGWALIASDALYLSQRQLDSIAEQIINNNWIENIVGENSSSSPTNKNQDANSINQISPSDIRVSYAGSLNDDKYNNLEGTALFDITILNGFGMVNGIAQETLTIKNVEIGGFVKLTPTEIPQLSINSDIIASDFIEDQSLVDQIKNEILNNLITNNMIPPGEKITIDNIHIKVKNQDDWNGTLNVEITIDVPYVNNLGNVVDSTFVSTTTINGFARERNWFGDNWFVILIAAAGGLILIILLVLFIMRKWRRDQLQ